MKQYDPKTPNFSYADVEKFVSLLEVPALEVLALGPIVSEPKGAPAEDRCRACAALWPASVESAMPSARAAAVSLLEWHDDLGVSDRWWEIHSKWLPEKLAGGQKPSEEIGDEVKNMLGRIAYARCSTLYAMAGRRLAQLRGAA